MYYDHHTYPNADAAFEAASGLLASWLDEGQVPVLLVPSSAAVLRARRLLAAGPLRLGVRVETADAWVRDRWELFGDGRRIVEPGERELLVRRACEEGSAGASDGAPLTAGAVPLLAGLAREALPQLLEARASGRADVLSEAERAAVEALARYAEDLRDRGLCEWSQAAFELPSAMPQTPPVAALGFDRLDCAHGLLLDALAARGSVVRVDDACTAPNACPRRSPEIHAVLDRLFKPADEASFVEPAGDVRVLLPAGRYAAPRLVLRAALRAVEAERMSASSQGRAARPVVVAARDPHALFEQMADACAAHGASIAVSDRMPFADTAFGRAFSALLSLSFDEDYRAAQATDFALSAFSGIPQRTAFELDASWRANRCVDRARIVSDLAAASEAASEVLGALAAGDVDGALARFEERLRRRADLDAAFRSVQLSAVSAARSFASSCAHTGTSVPEARALLERASVPVRARVAAACEGDLEGAADDRAGSGAQGRPTRCEAEADVLLLPLSEAAERPSCSCAALVLCDLSSAAYPVRAVEDGASLLLEKLGLASQDDPLAAARRRLFRSAASACDALVLERPLNTEDADESYPAVMFDEVVDCYRAGADSPADRATGLPAALAPYAETLGEGELQANLTLSDGPSAPGRSWGNAPFGEVSEDLRRLVVLPGRIGAGAPAGDPAPPMLSPSAVESYLECPCKWFSLRRLRLSEPDAGFGPMEMGSFSHGVLKSFYEHFREAGHPKVLPGNLPAARDLMRETFDRHLAFQPSLRPSRNPLVPRTAFEQSEADDLKRKLVSYLDREALLLPGFEPVHLEFAFGEDEAFPYAGCLLRGSVDRIDVNDRGQAVVIDYKGSLTADHALASASPSAQAGGAMLPHKVQALMYAQVARRVLGLDVVGAVYVSYGKDRRVAGAVDRTAVGEEALPGLDAQACGVPGPAGDLLGARDFAQLADQVEERIAEAARTLSRGFVEPDPRGADPCGFCPVLACERRMGS